MEQAADREPREGDAVVTDNGALAGFEPEEYAAEAEQRWGDSEAYRQSRQRTDAYTDADWAAIAAESELIEEGFAELLHAGEPASGAAAREAAEAHRAQIERWFYPCSSEVHVGLGEVYVADERFAAHYDRREPGLAAYIRDAIVANAAER